MTYFILVISSIAGLLLNHVFTHPQSKLSNKLPHIKIKMVQICPYLEIKLKTKSIRIHHWLGYGIILIITITVGGGLLTNTIANGYLVGAIAQGLSFPDWKQIIYRK